MKEQQQTIKAIFLAKALASTVQESILSYKHRAKQAANNFLNFYKEQPKAFAEEAEAKGNPMGMMLEEMANELAKMDVTRFPQAIAVWKMVNEGKFDKKESGDGSDEGSHDTQK